VAGCGPQGFIEKTRRLQRKRKRRRSQQAQGASRHEKKEKEKGNKQRQKKKKKEQSNKGGSKCRAAGCRMQFVLYTRSSNQRNPKSK
jgi:hypothetical protein